MLCRLHVALVGCHQELLDVRGHHEIVLVCLMIGVVHLVVWIGRLLFDLVRTSPPLHLVLRLRQSLLLLDLMMMMRIVLLLLLVLSLLLSLLLPLLLFKVALLTLLLRLLLVIDGRCVHGVLEVLLVVELIKCGLDSLCRQRLPQQTLLLSLTPSIYTYTHTVAMVCLV